MPVQLHTVQQLSVVVWPYRLCPVNLRQQMYCCYQSAGVRCVCMCAHTQWCDDLESAQFLTFDHSAHTGEAIHMDILVRLRGGLFFTLQGSPASRAQRTRYGTKAQALRTIPTAQDGHLFI